MGRGEGKSNCTSFGAGPICFQRAKKSSPTKVTGSINLVITTGRRKVVEKGTPSTVKEIDTILGSSNSARHCKSNSCWGCDLGGIESPKGLVDILTQTGSFCCTG
eukprot:Lithocolla_globosa_v1_NODE_658_length_3496_cov_53.897995.p2 type:complete len:105 gc:universal NODE_658_length_3496_cov_53.897995:363-677(+)